MAWSNRYQWLPFDVRLADKGFDLFPSTNSIVSYTNNAHPVDHRAFHYVTEKLIDKLMPLFNSTFADIKVSGYQDQRWHLAELGREPMILREPGSF
ncbi:hypothetical protein ABVK25_001804 [Lepraria finkii]|uniref:DUF4246 domain-containing protein n=1 Tax=Lepraria finkii TaxID=1340010 RepID=A0ABR4BMX5_9LECA